MGKIFDVLEKMGPHGSPPKPISKKVENIVQNDKNSNPGPKEKTQIPKMANTEIANENVRSVFVQNEQRKQLGLNENTGVQKALENPKNKSTSYEQEMTSPESQKDQNLDELILNKMNKLLEQKQENYAVEPESQNYLKPSMEKKSTQKNNLRKGLETYEPVKSNVKTPAPIPKLHTNRTQFIPGLLVTGQDVLLNEYFKTLKTQLLRSMKERSCRSLMITSVRPQEGKSFISANLSASIALGIDEHVLLVEADFRKPVLAERLDMQNEPGLSEFLSGEISDVSKIIKPSGLAKLSIVTAGQKKESASHLLSSVLMTKLLLHFQTRYDDRYVIIDAPPVHLAETLSVSEIVDSTLLVIDTKNTGRKELNNAIDLLDKNRIIGILMNNFGKIDEASFGYYNTKNEKKV